MVGELEAVLEKMPDVQKCPEEWKDNVKNELNDLANGIVRDEGVGLKR